MSKHQRKILFFSPYFYPYISGLTIYPERLLTFLAQQELEQISVLTFNHDRHQSNKEKYHDFWIHRMPYWFMISKGFISLRSLYYFLRFMTSHDVLVVNLPNAEGLPLVILAKLLRKKIIVIFHCQVSLGKKISERIIEKLLKLVVNCQLKLSDKIIFYTKDYCNSLNLPFIKEKAIFFFPPIHDLPVSQDYLDGLLKKKRHFTWIGFAGRIAREKGLEYLIEAISIIKTKQKMQLVICGPYGKQVAGEDDYYQRILTSLKQHKIDCIFLGTLQKEKLGAFYKAIDVLVLPSINQTEAFGMVQAEAMLLGTPVVASNLPGVRVPIQLTEMGLIVPPANPYLLAPAIVTIINRRSIFTNKDLVKKAKDLFSLENFYQSWKTLLS